MNELLPAPGDAGEDPTVAMTDDEARIEAATALAAELLRAARAAAGHTDRATRRRQRRMARIVGRPAAQEFVMALTDDVMRIGDRRRAVRRLRSLVAELPADALGRLDRWLLRAGVTGSLLAPGLVMAMVERRVRAEAAGVVIPATDPGLARHLATRRRDGMGANVNVLGEAILSDAEARQRSRMIIEQLERVDVDYVSLKLSALSAHVSALSFDATVRDLVEVVRPILSKAAASSPAKFVNFDMEEYRDLALTTEVFRTLLDEEAFVGLGAGIVLQAYLPDSHAVAEDLCEWARRRVEGGGAPIKIRLVKGANLAMEQVDAELHGWTSAPYPTKHDVDASYKALLDRLLEPRYDGAVRVGVASHNVFDLAWAMLAKADMERAGRSPRVEMEMLEGMAPEQAAAVAERVGRVLLYTPIVGRNDFTAAIAYLARRLDENTAPDNFLTSLYVIEPGNAVFAEQAARFAAAVRARRAVSTGARRRQDRRRPVAGPGPAARFTNEPDTDFTLSANREWLADALAAWEPMPPSAPIGIVDVEAAVTRARTSGWGATSGHERAVLVDRIGDVVAARRGEILAVMAHEAAKTIAEGDPEVSEAVDFARFYARSALELDQLDLQGAPSGPLGTVVVAPPWNFPFAIALGGVTAALAAGNAVILKPAPQVRHCGWLVAECCWAAGIPADALQFLPTDDDEAGRHLITHPAVDAVILTGALATARTFFDWRPGLQLRAETSGKNALVITAAADLDLAIRDLVRSAFSHAGQKCSAASLAIVEASVYDDPTFARRLRDAAASLRVGPSLDLTTEVGPLIGAPGPDLLRALTRLDEGESWLLEPVQRGTDLWSPGIRWDVRPGSWFARTECFGPVLGVIRARDLDHAIEIQNSSALGLTAGLHSLDPAEIDRWVEAAEAGNLYVNRGITGAIVGRQPFGGWKDSVAGPAAKAGGPDYVMSLRRWSPGGTPTSFTDRMAYAAAGSDPTGLSAESNRWRLRPLPRGVVLRIGPGAAEGTEAIATEAAAAAGVRLVVSRYDDEADGAFADTLASLSVDRLRMVGCGPESDEVRRAAHRAGIPVDEAPLVANARVEIGRWCREQVVTRTLHRHGHVRRTQPASAIPDRTAV